MKAHHRLLSLALILLLLVSTVAASSRASFCKCSCKRNSTIIALTGSYKSTSGSLSSDKSSHGTNSTSDSDDSSSSNSDTNTSKKVIPEHNDLSPSDIAAAAAHMHDDLDTTTNTKNVARDTTSKASNTPSEDDSTSENSDSDIIGGGPDKTGETVNLGSDHARTCNDCNRQFCLWHDLPILEDCRRENKGNEEDIFAECFQRDSAKDQAVVYTFIILTAGLLIYAAVRPWLEKRGVLSGKSGGVGLGIGNPAGGIGGSRAASYVPVRQEIGIVGPAGTNVDDFAGSGDRMERASSATRGRYE
ncbi:MAG: hypothetical protein M1831_000840 [Alyxoria varia]|nr:MAG: hypothetical protein M1831_000840 [Alyxoria varia]